VKTGPLTPWHLEHQRALYKVTEADQKNGTVVNEATATGTAPGGNDITIIPGKTTDPVLPAKDNNTTTPAAPTTPGQSNGPIAAIKKAVKTGDPMNAGLLTAVMASAAAAAGGVAVAGKRRKKNSK
jgi:hypothetical protein